MSAWCSCFWAAVLKNNQEITLLLPLFQGKSESMTSQITLITPLLNEQSQLILRPASAVILRLEAGDERAQINCVKKFTPLFQAQGTAVMVEATPEVAIRGGADGVHCVTLKAVKEATRHQPKFMVGVGGVFNRDEAMDLGETGVDYLLFEQDKKQAFDKYLALLAWWTHVFTIPAIGQAHSQAQAQEIAQTNVEFIGHMPQMWCL
jgi:thiamine-phosphate pyrophosphorylase